MTVGNGISVAVETTVMGTSTVSLLSTGRVAEGDNTGVGDEEAVELGVIVFVGIGVVVAVLVPVIVWVRVIVPVWEGVRSGVTVPV